MEDGKHLILASFKLLKVDKRLGLDGILRKLGIDPAPINDDEHEEAAQGEQTGNEMEGQGEEEAETGALIFLFFFSKNKRYNNKI